MMGITCVILRVDFFIFVTRANVSICSMGNNHSQSSELKTRLVLAAIAVGAMIVVAGMNQVDTAQGAGMQAAPKLMVSSMAQPARGKVQTPGAQTFAEPVVELTGQDVSWSADRKQLVFAKGSVLYLANGLGSEAHAVYSASGPVGSPRFSRDARQIRFSLRDPQRNTSSLWEVSRDGSNARPVLGQ